MTVPDLRGRWVGEQMSSYKGEDGRPVVSRVVLEVKQTFSGVDTKTYYHRWNDAHSASEFMRIDGEQYLVVIFESEPGVRHNSPDGANKGVARLVYRPEEQTIVGTYFNTNGNFGELQLKRTNRKLLHRFTAA